MDSRCTHNMIHVSSNTISDNRDTIDVIDVDADQDEGKDNE